MKLRFFLRVLTNLEKSVVSSRTPSFLRPVAFSVVRVHPQSLVLVHADALLFEFGVRATSPVLAGLGEIGRWSNAELVALADRYAVRARNGARDELFRRIRGCHVRQSDGSKMMHDTRRAIVCVGWCFVECGVLKCEGM